MDKIIKVLIVDDSAYIRKVIKQMLQRSPFIDVVGTASNGLEALEKVKELNPDVITLDLIMPEMDGVDFLQTLMPQNPKPVVITSIASEGGEMALRAMEAGAIEFIQKPTALATEKVLEITDELIAKVKAAAQARFIPFEEETNEAPAAPFKINLSKQYDILVLGVSTGGPQALKQLIPLLPADFPVPVCIVLHMPVGYTALYANKLNELSEIEVVEATDRMELKPGRVILAQAGYHLTLAKSFDGKYITRLNLQPVSTLHRPSVDALFRSAAEVFESRVLGVIMTGMGSDGKEGAAWIKAKGGTIITQDEESCVVYGMPRSVVEAGLSDQSVNLNDMLNTIIKEITS